jgi:hypothetical protein
MKPPPLEVDVKVRLSAKGFSIAVETFGDVERRKELQKHIISCNFAI